MACALSLAPPSIQHFANQIEQVFTSIEGRFLVHKVATSILTGLGAIHAAFLPQSAGAIHKLIGQTDLLMGASQVFPYISYFMAEQAPEPQFVEGVEDGRVYVLDTDQMSHQTAFQKDVKTSFLVATAQVHFCWSCFVALVDFLSRCNIEVIATVSNTLGVFGVFGQAVGTVLTAGFSLSGDIAATVGACCLMLHEIGAYIERKDDSTYDLSAGQIRVAAQVALFALEAVKLAGLSVAILSPVGIIAGALGIWSFLDRENQQAFERAEQNRLYAIAKQQQPQLGSARI